MYPNHINPQFVQQKYGPQVTMGRGIFHSPRGFGNKQSLKENLNARQKPFFRHRQIQGFISPSLENAKESEDQIHECVL